MPLDNEAINEFLGSAEFIAVNGSSAFASDELKRWNFQNQTDGTFLGTRTFSNGTMLSLSAGSFIDGTAYPNKFGCMLTKSGVPICRYDWNAQHPKQKERTPHFHFWNDQKKRYFLDDPFSMKVVRDKLGAVD